MVTYIFGYESLKNTIIFFNFEFFPTFWKSLNFEVFSKNYILINISENLSLYSNYDVIRLKNTKCASEPQETQQKALNFC